MYYIVYVYINDIVRERSRIRLYVYISDSVRGDQESHVNALRTARCLRVPGIPGGIFFVGRAPIVAITTTIPTGEMEEEGGGGRHVVREMV